MTKHPRSQAGNIASPGRGSPGCGPSNPTAPEPRESALSGSPGDTGGGGGDRRGPPSGTRTLSRPSGCGSVNPAAAGPGGSSPPPGAGGRAGFGAGEEQNVGGAPARAPQTPPAPQNLTHPMYHMDPTYTLHYRHPLPPQAPRAPQCTPESHAPHALQAFHASHMPRVAHAPHGARAPRVPPVHLSTPSSSCTLRSPGSPLH